MPYEPPFPIVKLPTQYLKALEYSICHNHTVPCLFMHIACACMHIHTTSWCADDLTPVPVPRLIPELRPSSPGPAHSTPNGDLKLNPDSSSLSDDLTPAASPCSSPILGHRTRLISVSNPEPMIQLVAEGLLRKGVAMQEMLEDRLLISTLEDADGITKMDYKGEGICEVG